MLDRIGTFSQLARKLNSKELNYRSSKGVLREISRNIAGFPAKPDRKPRQLEPVSSFEVKRLKNEIAGTGQFLLVAEPAGFSHRATDLSSKVEGLGELALEEGFRLNPNDLSKLKLETGESAIISTGALEITGPVKADAECPEGVIYFYLPHAFGGLQQRSNLEPLYRLKANPVRVKVRAAKPRDKQKRKVKAASRR